MQYRDAGGQTRRVIVGEYGPMTPDEARSEVRDLRGAVVRARRDPCALDPAQARQRARHARRAEHLAPTVAQLADVFLAEKAEKRKPTTVRGYRYLIGAAPGPRAQDGIVRRALGTRRVADVTRADIEAFHVGLKSTPYQANRALAVLSAVFAYAETHGYRAPGTNPCRGVERFTEKHRERYLSDAEYAALGRTLRIAEESGLPVPPTRTRRRATDATRKHRPKDADGDGARPPRPASPVAVSALRFLLLSGWREHEALSLTWRELDAARGKATLADSKNGQSVRELGPEAWIVLDAMKPLRQVGNPHVFPGTKPGASFTDLARVWDAVRHAAGLQDVRLHDLRHAFASKGADEGLTLQQIGALLGHRNTATTAKYTHLVDDARSRAALATCGSIAAAMAGPAGPEAPRSSEPAPAPLPFARRA
jgi:integrase